MKELNDIVSGFIQNKKGAVLNPALETLSSPVCGQTNGKPVDRFFLYSNQPNTSRTRPYAWLEMDSETGKVLKYLSCEAEDFASELKVPLGTMMNYQIPQKMGVKELLANAKHLTELYEKVRLFAFSNCLNKEQIRLLTEYLMLQKRLVSSELLDYYHQLSPEFYSWADSMVAGI